jgi:hypothetical protein
MSDLSAEQLTVLRKLGAHPALTDSVVAHDLIAAMVAEIDRNRMSDGFLARTIRSLLEECGITPSGTGSEDLGLLEIEIKRYRAMGQRLNELALSLEHGHHPDQRKLGAELRKRIKGQ